jgi:SET domain-containing protein
MDVIIKKSKIQGKGVFAARDFTKGEIVLKWHPRSLNTDDVNQIPKKDLKYAAKIDGKYFLQQSPERYVNQSCEPNTFAKNKCDIALRDIKRGEEITTNYGEDGFGLFECNCGNEKCKNVAKIIK